MYAVIETGGKQYRVEVGTELEVELLEAAPGDNITIDRVLLVADGDESTIGRPVVTDAAVEAEVVRRERGEKLISFKYRPKARRRVKKGHRQELMILRITDVKLNGKSAAAEKRKADADARSERQRLEEAAAKQAAEDAALAAKLAKASAPKTTAKPETKSSDAKGSKPAAKATAKAAPKAAAKADSTRKTTTPRAKTQSGAADAKPASKPSAGKTAAKPKAKPAPTKKDE